MMILDVNVDDLLTVNRIEDEGNDLWTVFNRIQENLTADVLISVKILD
jgi:hypothetical protein